MDGEGWLGKYGEGGEGLMVMVVEADSVCLRRLRVDPKRKFLILVEVWWLLLAVLLLLMLLSCRLVMGDGIEALPTDLWRLRKKKPRITDEGLVLWVVVVEGGVLLGGGVLLMLMLMGGW